MISIDGSAGEGGGQILRTATALSAVTGEGVKITNIRAKRLNPGLRPQHIAAIKATGQLCDADIDGLSTGCTEIKFIPREIRGGDIKIDVGTAGSLTLILQALMIPANHAPDKVKITLTGGTDVKWSPPIDYLLHVTLPLLRKFNYIGDIKLIKRGYYPRGGGRVTALIKPSRLEEIVLRERGEVIQIKGISHAHMNLENARVAERQIKGARSLILNHLPNCRIEMKQGYIKALSIGSGILAYAVTEKSVLGSSSLGERGKRAESVGIKTGTDLITELESNAPLDKYMADQIVPYLALGGGEVRVSEITEHCRTNMEVVNKFGFNLEILGDVIKSIQK